MTKIKIFLCVIRDIISNRAKTFKVDIMHAHIREDRKVYFTLLEL